MKINIMWAMFDERKIFSPYTIVLTRREAIRGAERDFGMKWGEIKKHGYRIEKVVVLRADEFEAAIKAAREEVLKLALHERGNVNPWIEETAPRIMDAIDGGTSESIADIIHQELHNAAEVGRRRHSTAIRQAYKERYEQG